MPTNSLEYQRENYSKYYGTKKALKKRALRNAARRKMEKAGLVNKGDGKDVDHIKGVEKGNGDGNLRVITRLKNRVM